MIDAEESTQALLRMRAEIDRLRADIDALTIAANAEATEVDRLRAALTQFVAACSTAPPTSLMKEINIACGVAIEALNGTRTEQPQMLPSETDS